MMEQTMTYTAARELLMNAVGTVATQQIPLSDSLGRVLAQDLTAGENVPAFDRSPYDGFAFRAADSLYATPETPVTLDILEEIPAGGVSRQPVTPGTAVKLLTGAPIPAGADAVTKYELTRFTAETVTLFQPSKPGDNIVRAGEDVQAGELLALAGTVIDPGLAGTLAAQGITEPGVYRRPRVGIISTGNEVMEADAPLAPGKIRNTNRYTFTAALEAAGCQPVYLGIAADLARAVADKIFFGAERCDAVVLTGGASVGDYDTTPEALRLAGATLLVRNVRLKPGGACVYGLLQGKLVCGLSGNPASALTNFYAVVLPALKKLAGQREPVAKTFPVTLASSFPKKSPNTRLLRGRLELSDGIVKLVLPQKQGNAVLSSTIGCSAMAEVPAGSGPLAAGTVLKGFLL